MPGAYWVGHITVTNPDEYAEYAKRATVAVHQYGGRFLARGGAFEVLEGSEHPRHVVTYFPSMDAARACYNSPEYQEALTFSRTSSIRDLVIIEALE